MSYKYSEHLVAIFCSLLSLISPFSDVSCLLLLLMLISSFGARVLKIMLSIEEANFSLIFGCLRRMY